MIGAILMKFGLAPTTSSLAKVGRALADQADEADRMRAHYLLARYAHRSADDVDPLAPRARKKATPKKTATKKDAD